MDVKPILDAETYATERAICDKAAAYWSAHASYIRGSASALSAELAKHPDYAACDSAMRSRVQQYELLRDKPARFAAYIGKDGFLTTWCGDKLGVAMPMSTWKTPRSYVSSTMTEYHVVMAGRKYHGRCAGEGMSILLRAMR